MIKRTLIFILAASSCAFAQTTQTGGPVFFQSTTSVATVGAAALNGGGAPVVGAPYSATITNESIQTLPDGNRIVQNNTGVIARDSQGRTRQDAPLPMIGNLSAANAPHLVFLRDPVTQTSYHIGLGRKKSLRKCQRRHPGPPA